MKTLFIELEHVSQCEYDEPYYMRVNLDTVHLSEVERAASTCFHNKFHAVVVPSIDLYVHKGDNEPIVDGLLFGSLFVSAECAWFFAAFDCYPYFVSSIKLHLFELRELKKPGEIALPISRFDQFGDTYYCATRVNFFVNDVGKH